MAKSCTSEPGRWNRCSLRWWIFEKWLRQPFWYPGILSELTSGDAIYKTSSTRLVDLFRPWTSGIIASDSGWMQYYWLDGIWIARHSVVLIRTERSIITIPPWAENHRSITADNLFEDDRMLFSSLSSLVPIHLYPLLYERELGWRCIRLKSHPRTRSLHLQEERRMGFADGNTHQGLLNPESATYRCDLVRILFPFIWIIVHSMWVIDCCTATRDSIFVEASVRRWIFIFDFDNR